ncbi:chemosensory receptor A [Elysia marginata]|uniref:Chemosensory receptor A n=1 Tax=Elysia marginata TaxID=1093978 RepID=A0AAV4GJ10_9GAST|nr:chemosensory receptor A [Elysia marginata]
MEDTGSLTSTLALSTLAQKHAALPYQNQYFMTIKLLAPLGPGIILFGLISNITNIVVFFKTGARDNVTILLLSLAMSDILFLLLISPSACGYVIRALHASHAWPFDRYILYYLLYWPAFTAYDISAFISVSLAAMRCACVAMPLKFKSLFTRTRTVKWVMFLVVLAVLLRIPVLTIYRISWRLDPSTNISSPYLEAVNNVHMSRINDILNRGIVIYVAYITMVTCVVVLTFKLYQASMVRRLYTATSHQWSTETPGKPDDQGLSSKDVQVIKSVVLVCTIFILSQLPFLLSSTTRLITPEFDNGRQFVYLFAMFSQINRICSYLNASLNIFVYYNCNSRFRHAFLSLFFDKRIGMYM